VVAALFGAIEDGNLNAIQELFSMSKIDANQCNRVCLLLLDITFIITTSLKLNTY
jgi:hypothetical protein